ncbi:hypothetical protein BD410DRAFT_794554 [Rickenella mellea]|uniref:Uncharacterized protein n=1 Tax=Rickenella mellea TaxID=50990 RepID=A0A4Y7PP88_9AGAM|nr:hypothetical protein BD410DRAFT_794554 [Rickenella mellea]
MPDSANCTDLDGRRDEPLYPKEGFVHGADALPPSLVSPAVFPGTENTGQIQMTEYTSSKPQSHTPKTPKRQTPSQSRNPRDKIKHAPGALSSSSSAYNSSQAIPPIPSATQTPRQKSIQSATSSSGSSVRVRLGENFNPGSTTPAMPNGRRDVSIKPTPTTPYRRNWRP